MLLCRDKGVMHIYIYNYIYRGRGQGSIREMDKSTKVLGMSPSMLFFNKKVFLFIKKKSSLLDVLIKL
jgi:hypothetical protein